MSTNGKEEQPSSSTAVAESKANNAQEFSVDLLRVFYGRLFPYEQMFNWLSYSNDPNSQAAGNDRSFFMRREWSFTLEDDVYVRYQSFRDINEFSQMIQSRQPHKLDIGAVFTIRPEMNIKSESFKPVERELVFDIDMTDYDDIRTCCTGADICKRCWPYMTMAIKVVDRSLREDFAFRHILWVYSGRRGVHCWVCDPEARSLSNDARAAVVDYLSVHTGSAENSDKKLKASFANPHPMMRRAYDLLDPYFERYIADERGQGLLAKKERYMSVLNSIPNESVRKDIYDYWEKHPKLSGAERWQFMKQQTSAAANESNQSNQVKRKRINYLELEAWRYELVFTHCYPRLDANVSKTQNHLLKSPFCVHPKTGRVCIPIDADNADGFSPFEVPTVRSLCGEIDEYDRTHDQTDAKIADVKKTSLQASLDFFNSSFLSGLQATNRKQIREKADEESAMNVDF